ncbi:hypothetical protein [Sporosarcina sp. HYO08]|uniref:hypothetical protein n=1 Tax=Sporosarcina sp. HYO08 TaxID=1759557 RepID=UPI0007978284|nr:hypothetical protein [Sporosarcina sp. HYO08]KXH83999.1 hypothetical protein AU377_04400 [Sporosarcina sp. HYO08]
MLKKAIPLVLMSGLVLTACMNNGALPRNDETPMQNVEDRARDWTPNVNDGQTGPNLDGIDNNRNNINGNGVRDGVINDNNPNGVINDDTTLPGEVNRNDNIRR